MKGFTDLIVYQKAFALAMDIFEITKKFPKEETYSLIDQIRRISVLYVDDRGIIQKKKISGAFCK